MTLNCQRPLWRWAWSPLHLSFLLPNSPLFPLLSRHLIHGYLKKSFLNSVLFGFWIINSLRLGKTLNSWSQCPLLQNEDVSHEAVESMKWLTHSKPKEQGPTGVSWVLFMFSFSMRHSHSHGWEPPAQSPALNTCVEWMRDPWQEACKTTHILSWGIRNKFSNGGNWSPGVGLSGRGYLITLIW